MTVAPEQDGVAVAGEIERGAHAGHERPCRHGFDTAAGVAPHRLEAQPEIEGEARRCGPVIVDEQRRRADVERRTPLRQPDLHA